MGLALLFFIPFYIVLLLPLSSFLLFLVRLLCQVILSIFWKQARTHFTLWPPDSSFIGHRRPALDVSAAASSMLHDKLEVCRYKMDGDGGGGGGGGGEQTECVFCLCAVEEGDEIRQLRCRHVFHRACLDKWLDHGRASCPLCRGPLLPPGEEARLAQAEAAEEEGLLEEFSSLPLTVLIRSSLRVW